MKFVLLLMAMAIFATEGFQLGLPRMRRRSLGILQDQQSPDEQAEWGVGDDWNHLSEAEDQTNYEINQDYTQLAAYQMQDWSWTPQQQSPEEEWLTEALEGVHDTELDEDDSSTSLEMIEEMEKQQQEIDGPADLTNFVEDMSRELSLLIRCNQSPEEMLIAAGKALPKLGDDERNDVQQLVQWADNSFQPTPFLKSAIYTMFRKHARRDADGQYVMDAKSVAAWMVKSLGGEPCGPHDLRVTQLISKYGQYGTRTLLEKHLLHLYLDTIVGQANSLEKLKYRTKERDIVWRDLRNHGILAPVELERAEMLKEIGKNLESIKHSTEETMLDECEVDYNQMATWEEDEDGVWQRQGKTSHELVPLASDKKTPMYMNDGDFIFIDEESCIGCMQCVTASPASFTMLDDGRARAFAQRKAPDVDAAVAACPVSCMHRVGFDRLKKLEVVRDQGDGRSDHRHFGKNERTGGWIPKTPVHLSRRDSDANHKSSWYHYTQQKCYLSSDCPKAGCYDCPHFSTKGANPFCQQKMKDAIHARAQHYIQSGAADKFRKTVEL